VGIEKITWLVLLSVVPVGTKVLATTSKNNQCVFFFLTLTVFDTKTLSFVHKRFGKTYLDEEGYILGFEKRGTN